MEIGGSRTRDLAGDWTRTSVLIVGCGSAGQRHARVLHSLGISDIRIADPREEQRKQLSGEVSVSQEFSDYHAGLEGLPDCVFICTPPDLHIATAIDALNAGADVFCEKPLSDSMRDVEALRLKVESSGHVFAVGFCFRFHEGMTRAKALLDSGEIGRLISIRSRMGEHLPTVRRDFRALFSLQKTGALDLAHEIDLSCWLAGQPVREVRSLSGTLSDIGFTAPDVVEILVAFGDRCLASIHLDLFSIPRMRATEILGTEGAIVTEYASWDECTVAVYSAKSGAWRVERLHTERDHMFRSEDEDFLCAVTTGSPVFCPLSEAVKSQQIVELAQR